MPEARLASDTPPSSYEFSGTSRPYRPSGVGQGITNLLRRFPLEPLPPGRKPVFVLSAGWRSGSTLMQRLVASTHAIFMWGESYEHSGFIRKLASTFEPMADPWPSPNVIADPGQPPDTDSWMARMYPHPAHVLAAHRAFFDRLFAVPSESSGLSRWGLKDVRLSGEHAYYLSYIYPDARFLLVHRNPYDAYLSYRALLDLTAPNSAWHWNWPSTSVSTAEEYASMWRHLVESFIAWSPLLNAEICAYEEFSLGVGLDRIDARIEERVDRSVLRSKVGSTWQRDGDWSTVDRELTPQEIVAIRSTAGSTARRLGYHGPSRASRTP